MKHVRKSVLLWYSPHEMYELVTDIERYPAFLPWCDRAEIVSLHEDGVTARLGMAYGGVRQAFTTRNRQQAGTSVAMDLVDGPFSRLSGGWRFLPLNGESRACRIEFDLHYAFASRALQAVVSPVFDRIADTFVESFVRRAEQVHGAR